MNFERLIVAVAVVEVHGQSSNFAHKDQWL